MTTPASRSASLATGVLALSAAVVAWTVVRAIRLDATPDAAPLELATADALAPAVRLAAVDIKGAVEGDIFAPDRSAPARHYRLPGEADAADEPVAPPPTPVVLGTAIAEGMSSFATVQLENGAPRIVRVGDHIGVYTVKQVDRGRVVFTNSSGKKFDIPALKPGQ